MPALLLGLGIVSVALLLVNDSIRERVLVRDAEVARQVAEVGTRLATLHLWVEEYVTGDTVDLEEVREHQSRSRAILASLLGEETGPVAVERETLPVAYLLLRRLQPQVERFVALSNERLEGHDSGAEVGVGSAVDVEYDRVFYGLSADLQTLDQEVEGQLQAAHEQSRTLFRILLLAWATIIAVSVVAIWTRESRHRAAEAALRRSKAQLQQAQKMEAIGSLAGGLAHDINNYLAAISAQCEVVHMRCERDDSVARKMEIVIETCNRASALLERLLAFSRGQPIQRQVVSLNRVVRGLEEMASRLIGENVRLELDLAKPLWTVEIDVSQVEQSILNLLVNARDAMPTGGEVRVETRNVPAAESPLATGAESVALRVSDSGPGIARELREKIFEPFFTTKEMSKNSGLGLATVYGIVGQNGGLITTVDTPGRGATFDLFFPRSEGRAKKTQRRRTVVESASRGSRILLVEDNEELRASTEEILREVGFVVASAADGQTALEVFENADEQFHLLLTDVVMPGMNGSELAEEITNRDPAVRVLYASGYTGNVVLRHGVDDEAINFLPKPYSARRLTTAIERVLGRERTAGARGEAPLDERAESAGTVVN
jgi:signal transduction histidine kinase/CheY-like chemotaxis protein